MAKQSESRFLTTKAEVMTALGGLSGLTKLIAAADRRQKDELGSAYKQTENWTRSETFPARYHALMMWALRQKRLRADPALWGQVTIPEMDQRAA